MNAAALPRAAATPAVPLHRGRPTLDADHRAHCSTSGLSDDTIDGAGIHTGHHPTQGRAIVFPLVAFWRRKGKLIAEPVEFLYRPDTPRTELRDDGSTRAVKYERVLGSRARLFVHPDDLALLSDRTVPIYVVEGHKKLLKLRQELRAAGIRGVVIHGNGIWTLQRKTADDDHVLLPDWSELPLRERAVILVPDSDAEPGGTTHDAWHTIAQLLVARDAGVTMTHLADAADGSKVGPDDAMVGGMALETLLGSATPIHAPVPPGWGAPTWKLFAALILFASVVAMVLRMRLTPAQKTVAIALYQEKLLGRINTPLDAPISFAPTVLANRLRPVDQADERAPGVIGQTLAELARRGIVSYETTTLPGGVKKSGSVTPAAFWSTPDQAPVPEAQTRPEPQPAVAAVIVPTACACGSPHTVIERACHADGCGEVVTFYDGTADPICTFSVHIDKGVLGAPPNLCTESVHIGSEVVGGDGAEGPLPVLRVSPPIDWSDFPPLKVKGRTHATG